MGNITFEYVLLALLGMTIHVVMKVLNRSNKSEPLSLRFYLRSHKNWLRGILTILSVIAILYMADDIGNMLGITLSDGSPAKGVMAFLAGYMNHSLIRNLLKVIEK